MYTDYLGLMAIRKSKSEILIYISWNFTKKTILNL
jgi:hypothetical protein